MQPTQVTAWITKARFAPYLEEAGGEHEKALALYIWNARISAAAFETLHHIEVILRNAVDVQFAPLEGGAAPRDTWLENPAVLNDASRQRVHETIGRISREGKTPTRGRVVAGLSFGFWRALFDKKYAGLWVSHLHRAFPAGSGERAEVATLMSNLVPFRNRLAHHETIVRRPISTHYEGDAVPGGADRFRRKGLGRGDLAGERDPQHSPVDGQDSEQIPNNSGENGGKRRRTEAKAQSAAERRLRSTKPNADPAV